MHSLHIPRHTPWSRRKAVLVFGSCCLVFWSLVIWVVRALLQ
jgi:hypothetical protein